MIGIREDFSLYAVRGICGFLCFSVVENQHGMLKHNGDLTEQQLHIIDTRKLSLLILFLTGGCQDWGVCPLLIIGIK